MNKATLLKLNQIYGENRLEIIRQYGAQSIITDFSILLDGFVLNNYHAKNGFTLENRTGNLMNFSRNFSEDGEKHNDICKYFLAKNIR